MKDGTYIRAADGNLMPIFIDYGYWVASREIDPNTLAVGQYLGVWTDENGKVWYDLSHFIEDRGTALMLCRYWNQKAIWDCANAVEIPMNPNY